MKLHSRAKYRQVLLHNNMPVAIRKVNGFRVSTPGSVKAKSTTQAKAQAQKRLLNAIEHGFKPTKNLKK